jgi:hypothetical protein
MATHAGGEEGVRPPARPPHKGKGRKQNVVVAAAVDS